MVTEEMVEAGEQIASELLTANICKNMGSLGGSKTWAEWLAENKDNPNLDLLIAYTKDEISSVEAIYSAMDRVRILHV